MRLVRLGLGRAARRSVERALTRFAGTPAVAALTGAVVAAVVQSSGAVTVMVVGLVDAGVLDSYRAFGVIMGANLGTCVTAHMISFRGEAFAIPAILLGIAWRFAARRRLSRDLGVAAAGLGCILGGVGLTHSALVWLANLPWLLDSLVVMGQAPLLGVLAGTAFTAIIQSSSVTTAVLVGLARQGLIDLSAAAALALGSNVGSCATTLIASLGASSGGRLAAILHLAFNAAGVAIVLPFFGEFVSLVRGVSPPDAGLAIANAHTLFNLVSLLVVLPWSRRFVDIVKGGRPWTL